MRFLYPRWLPWHGIAINSDLVLIRSDHKHDKGLHAHELVHCDQQAEQGAVIWWFRYLTSRDFRQAQEVEAYKTSVAHAPHRINQFAHTLATRYRLGITSEQAFSLLTTP
jgi:hypothetical protein